MAYIVEPKGKNKEALLKVLKEKAKQEGNIISLRQQDVVDGTNGVISNSAQISGFISFYKEKGLIVQVERGNITRPSRYDISALLEAENEPEIVSEPVPVLVAESTTTHIPHEVEVEIVKEEANISDSSANPLADISATLKEMAFYIESIKEIKQPLEDMTSAINQIEKGEDPTPYKEEIAALKLRIEELESAPKTEFNKHLIYRSRNYILDEIERYFMMPGWQRKSKETYLKMAINNHLAAMMKELGIEATTDTIPEF